MRRTIFILFRTIIYPIDTSEGGKDAFSECDLLMLNPTNLIIEAASYMIEWEGRRMDEVRNQVKTTAIGLPQVGE
jgi:hypothetical protein